jgi:hypothetical protein
MTKKQNARPTTESATEAATGAYGSIVKALGGLQSKFEIPETAREFVKRGAATAKDRAAALHDGANKVSGVIDGAIVDAVTGVADINRKLIDTARDDTEATLAAIDKLAAAKSLAEAYQLGVDYWRERGEVGMARAKNVAAFVSAKVYDGVKAVEDGASKMVPSRQAA